MVDEAHSLRRVVGVLREPLRRAVGSEKFAEHGADVEQGEQCRGGDRQPMAAELAADELPLSGGVVAFGDLRIASD